MATMSGKKRDQDKSRRNELMPRRHHIQLIAKQRPFDEERWQRLLIAFAYVLHERRTAQTQAQQTAPGDTTATDDAPANGGMPWTP
jgi:hypothetical protein